MPVPTDPVKYAAFCQRISRYKKAHPVRYWLGKKRSPETALKISISKRGGIPWNKGKTIVLSNTLRRKYSRLAKLRCGQKASNWKGGKPHCIDCGKQVFYASKRCIPCDNKRKHSLRGPLARSWKGGVTPIMLVIRHCQKTRDWRTKIFTRDNYACVRCRARSMKGKAVVLHADHYPVGFASIIHRYQVKTLGDALKCKALWNIDNGRTLCRDCHRERHGLNPKKVELQKAA